MNYKKMFTDIIEKSKATLPGCVEVFNYIANSRYLEHLVLHETIDKDVYQNDEGSWTVTCIADLVEELSYWLSCYYESGHCRHDEEFADRLIFIRGIEVLSKYCESFDTRWYRYIPKNKDTKNLFN